ncbi:MAG: hypothetical protein JO197_19285 [Acidobacteria bacterium]|nr:hypothetical protein [Acidobacteriota bacterium]MBV9477049.1 hypothetical protein [Acidobacteriota bacterium]
MRLRTNPQPVDDEVKMLVARTRARLALLAGFTLFLVIVAALVLFACGIAPEWLQKILATGVGAEGVIAVQYALGRLPPLPK